MGLLGKLKGRREAGAPVTVRVDLGWRPGEDIRCNGAIVGAISDEGLHAIASGSVTRDGLSECLRACVIAYRNGAKATGMSRADVAQAAADVLADVFSDEREGAGHDAA